MNFGKQTYQHNFSVSFFSLGPNSWDLCDMTTIVYFIITFIDNISIIIIIY